MKKWYSLFIYFLCSCFVASTQPAAGYSWHNPVESSLPVISGRIWQHDLKLPYDRLPAKAEKTVRKEVWGLSHNTAGMYLSFVTNASSVEVRYSVSGRLSMNHMPATGVSGMDLYAIDVNNKWHWVRGAYSFADTITYRFSGITSAVPVKEFRLYLPLYNTPAWLQIGVPSENSFSFVEVDNKKPLVFYGTSIMQGACASRPGLAWTNILGRKLNRPVINLGFSGNGRLEPALIDLINEQEMPGLFILDCQPNLHDRKVYTAEEIEKRIRASVKSLQQKHPATPVLLVEHSSGLNDIDMDSAMTNKYQWTSQILNKTFHAMKKEGVKNIYLLTAAEIGFNLESTVDGTHPNDIGMMQYANAYEKKIREILKQAL